MSFSFTDINLIQMAEELLALLDLAFAPNAKSCLSSYISVHSLNAFANVLQAATSHNGS